MPRTVFITYKKSPRSMTRIGALFIFFAFVTYIATKGVVYDVEHSEKRFFENINRMHDGFNIAFDRYSRGADGADQ